MSSALIQLYRELHAHFTAGHEITSPLFRNKDLADIIQGARVIVQEDEPLLAPFLAFAQRIRVDLGYMPSPGSFAEQLKSNNKVYIQMVSFVWRFCLLDRYLSTLRGDEAAEEEHELVELKQVVQGPLCKTVSKLDGWQEKMKDGLSEMPPPVTVEPGRHWLLSPLETTMMQAKMRDRMMNAVWVMLILERYMKVSARVQGQAGSDLA